MLNIALYLVEKSGLQFNDAIRDIVNDFYIMKKGTKFAGILFMFSQEESPGYSAHRVTTPLTFHDHLF